MKLKNIFEEETIGDDCIMVSLDNNILNGIIRANASASFILSCLKNDITLDDLILEVSKKYDISHEIISDSVSKFISQLRSMNLLEE